MVVIKVNYSSVYPVIKITYDDNPIYIKTSVDATYVSVNYSAINGGGSATWGTITGTLSNQTDLQNALNAKVPYSGATANVDLGEYELKAGQIEYDQTPTGVAGVATTRWNDNVGTIETTLKGGNVILKHGRDMFERIVNKTGIQLTKAAYQAVRISTAQGQRLGIALAQANNDNNSADTIGLVVETIDNNQEGIIYTIGEINDINTTGSLQSETWSDGDVLYLSPTIAGRITNVKPVAPQHLVVIGYVVYAHANHGKIYVKIMNGWELGELHDVNTNGATNGQVLRYNGTIWVNDTDYVGTVTSVGLSAPTGFSVSGSPVTSSGILGLSFVTGYSLPTTAKQTEWDTAYTNRITTLTTTGSSGAATLVNNTLNIPNYTLSGLGGVPTSRQLTINGTALDLSADRSWSVGTVTSVAALTIGTTGTDITSSVANGTSTPVITLNIPTASATNRGALSSIDWTTFNNKQGAITLTTTGNSGAATFVTNTLNIPNYTLSGLGGVPTTRTLTINGTAFDLSANRSWSVGTVTSVAATAGTGISISGSPITSSGTLTITNTAPDQVVSLTGTGTTSVSGTYPSFTITSNDQYNGTVTSVSVVSANGLAGTVANASTTPAITLSTTVTGILKGNGTGISAAVAGTDYVIPSALNSYLPLAGGTMSGFITLHANPTQALHAVTKQYVDAIAEGLHVHASCEAATPNTLASITGGTVTYNNGTSGVGATLTLSVALNTLDGVTLVNGNRILVKNEANTAHNGIYVRTSSTILTRASDFDTATEIAGGDFVFITGGTLYDNSGWVQTEACNTIGTDPVLFQQFSGAGTYLAGTGLTLTGNTFSANIGTDIQGKLTLTTTGNSGSATLVTNTLNIPTYTLTGLGGFANPMTTLGDIIYGAASGTATRLAGNTTTAKQYLSQTGNGTNSAAPSWATIAGSDITGAALTKTDDTNVTLTLGGTPSTALLRAASLTLGWTGQLAVGRGGSGASTLTGVLIGNGTSAFTGVAGTASQYLRRNAGNTAYEFGAIAGADVTGAALTKTDDTNVTLTLGGTPATSLLRAASLTLGWTGTLAVSRGGTGLSALGTANQLLRVNAGGTALEYFTPTYLTAAITSLNGLTAATQTFAVGTSGTDFAINSSTSTHTFNLPTASATNRGALSSADWTTFNSKQGAITLTTTGNSGAATLVTNTLNIPTYTLTGLGGFANPMTTLGDIIYGAASGTATRLAGNTTTAKQYLSQTGTGTASAAPAWATIAGSDITGAALTKTDDTNVTLTLGGTPSTALLRAVSLTLGWTGQLSVARGGTGAASFTAGQILYGNGTSAISSESNLFWDATNDRLGIGTNTPTAALQVRGTNVSSAIDFTNTTATTGRTYRWVSTNAGLFTIEDITASGAARFSISAAGTSIFSASVTAASAIARGVNITSTLVAAANNDVLVGLDIAPTYTNGAFTGVTNTALRVQGTTTLTGALSGTSATFSDTLSVVQSGNALLRVHASTNTTPVVDIEMMRGTNTTWGADAYGDYRFRNSAGNLTIDYGDSGVTTTRATIKSTGQLQLHSYQAANSFTGTYVGLLAFDVSGNILTLNTLNNTRIDPRSITTTSTATLTPDLSVDDFFTVTAQAAAITLANPTGTPVDGQRIIIRIKDNGTARAINYGTQYRGSSDYALPTTTTVNRTIYLGFIYNSVDVKWDLLAKLDNFA